MSLAALAQHLTATVDERVRWKLVWEFLEEYRWEPAQIQVGLVQAEPQPVGDERWDALLAALAEHLCAQHDLAPPAWAEPRVLRRAWFPAHSPSSAPMRWLERRQRSASMASTFPLMI